MDGERLGRFDRSVADGSVLARSGHIELRGDGGGWALERLELALYHRATAVVALSIPVSVIGTCLAVSLLGPRRTFDLDRLLRRGRHALEGEMEIVDSTPARGFRVLDPTVDRANRCIR